MNEAVRGALAVAFAAATWGTWKVWLVGPALDAPAQGAIVLTLSGLVGSALALARRRRFDGVPAAAWLALALFGASEAANYLLYFGALAAGDSAVAAVTHYLAPVLVALASPFAREPMGRRAPFAAAIAFAATLALVGLGGGGEATRVAGTLGAASAVFYAANVLVSKKLSRHFEPWELVGFHNLLAAPIVWSFSTTPPWTAGSKELLFALAGAALGGTLAAGVYFFGLARVTAARAAVLSYLEPVSAATVGVVLLGEALGPVKVLAIAIIVGAGAAVATEPMPRPGAREAA